MAIEVIKEGKIRKKVEKRYQGTCHNCGCIVRCLESDLDNLKKENPKRIRDYIPCPTEKCGEGEGGSLIHVVEVLTR